MNFKIPFSGRQHTYTKSEIEIVTKTMQDATPLTQGKYLKKFESEFSSFIGNKYSFAMNNATSALEISAQLINIKPGDEIIIPGHTYTSSAYPFLKKGGKIVWADIDLNTRVVTKETIEDKLTKKTKAIVIVHLYGYGAEMPKIMALAKQNNLIVIEDVAQAIGGSVQDKKCGTFGDLSVFSFHSHKNISTLGEGGMLSTNNETYSKLIPMLRHNGHCSFNFERQFYWLPAMGNVDMPEINGDQMWPNNFCLGEVECALGTQLLKRVEKVNAEKRGRAIKIIENLSEFPELKFHYENSNRHTYHLLVAKMQNNNRDSFIKIMSEEYSVQCVVQYYPLYRYDFYKKNNLGEYDCPNVDEFYDNMISFPFQLQLSENELEYMVDCTKKTLKKIK